MADKKKSGLRGGNKGLTVRVKTAKRRSSSSTQWLKRQLNDPYVSKAKADGYRSRAAYKLLQIHERYPFIGEFDRVVDLGAAPGSWCQAVDRLQKGKGIIIGLDLLPIEPLAGCRFIQGDIYDEAVLHALEAQLEGQKVHVVLSDMAAASCGHTQTDHIRILALCELALDFAEDWLEEGGHFCAKVLRGGAEKDLLQRLRSRFEEIHHVKPDASRKDSAEMYVIAKGFRGKAAE